MKNIVLMIDELLGGGAQRSTIKIATAFLNIGYDAHIIMMTNIIDFEIDSRLNIHCLNFEKGIVSSLSYIKYAKKLKRLLLKIDKESSISFMAGSLGLTHKLMDKAKLDDAYYMLRGTTSNAKIGDREGIRKSIKTKKVKKLYDNKNILCVSKGVEKDILSMGIIPKSIHTIYNPYDFDLIKELSLKNINFNIPEDEYLVHVGSFSQPKRHDILLKAFTKIKNKNIKLVLVGQGDEESNIKKFIKDLDIEQRVVFAGFQSNPYPIIKGASLLLLSSDHEGLPTVIVEAYALNVNVVSTDCPSGPYEIMAPEFEKYLSKVGDIEDFKNKIELALSDAKVKIPKSILKPFIVSNVIQQYERLFI